MQCVAPTSAATMAFFSHSAFGLTNRGAPSLPRQATPATTGPQVDEVEHWIPAPYGYCPQCSNHTRSSATLPTLGKVHFLPAKHRVPRDSCAFAPTTPLNDGAFGHPCIPLAISGCRHLVACAQVTSFGGSSIEAKYHAAGPDVREKMASQYSVIRHPGMQASSCSVLETTNGELEKQSYVNRQRVFWIEIDNITKMGGNPPTLAPTSLQKFKAAVVAMERDISQGRVILPELQRATPPPSPQAPQRALKATSWRAPSQQPALQAPSWRARGPQQLPSPPRTPSPPLQPASRKRAASPLHPAWGAKQSCNWRT